MSSIYAEFAPAFLDGALKTINQYAAAPAVPNELKGKLNLEQPIAIAGLIGVTAKQFEGSMSIGFTQDAYLDLIENMIGEKYESLTREIEDAAAEFANIIFGQAKIPLNEKGHDIRMALPNVVRGTELIPNSKINEHSVRYQLMLPRGFALLEIHGRLTGQNAILPPVKENAEIPVLDGLTLMSFVDAVKKALLIQCGEEAEPLKPFKKTAETSYQFDIGALIGVNGRSFKGTLGIAFEDKVYRKIYYFMTKEKHARITDEMEDGASELTNIIFGIAKTKLNEQGYGLEMALPSLIRGPKLEFKLSSKRPTITLPFAIAGGKMWVEFAFDSI